MATSNRPAGRSFGTLARAALADPSWPATTRVKERSLAAVLSQLDRGEDLDWLRDREDVQQVLAAALGCAVADLRRPFDAPPAADALQLRLADVRFARPLDLRHEDLPPGVPFGVLTPWAWCRTHWRAGSGTGRSLAGQWLSARRAARHVVARGPADVPRAPSSDAVLLEAPSAHASPSWAAALGEFALAHPRALVASPWAPELGGPVLATPELAGFARDLAAWVEARLPGGSFEAERASAWLLRAAAGGSAATLGDALGWLGAWDELGVRPEREPDPAALAERLVRKRIGELGAGGSTDPSWLRRHAFEVVTLLVRRALLSGDRSWDAPRSFDEWLALVPRELAQGADVEWLEHALGRDVAGRAADLERAARRVPPGAYRIVRDLERAHLLRRVDADSLVLGPRCVAHEARRVALGELTRGATLEWADALLAGTGASDVLDALLGAAPRSEAWLQAAAEIDEPSDATELAAIEGAALAAGLARLGGVDLDRDLVLATWNAALDAIASPAAALPSPLVGLAPAAADPRTSHGAWLIALVALSEDLPRGRGREHPLLRPWSGTPGPALAALYDALAPVLDQALALRQPWASGALEVVDRLRGVAGPCSIDDAEPHVIELPSAVLDEGTLGVVRARLVERLAARPGGIAAARALAAARGVEWGAVAAELWRAWHATGADVTQTWCDGASDHAELTWPHLPAPIAPSLADAPRPRWDLVPEATWRAALEQGAWVRGAAGLCELGDASRRDHVLRTLPGAQLVDVAAGAWRAAPAVCQALLTELVRAGDTERSLALALAAPEAEAALDRLSRDLRPAAWGLDHLTRRVRERGPAWRSALALLLRARAL